MPLMTMFTAGLPVRSNEKAQGRAASSRVPWSDGLGSLPGRLPENIPQFGPQDGPTVACQLETALAKLACRFDVTQFVGRASEVKRRARLRGARTETSQQFINRIGRERHSEGLSMSEEIGLRRRDLRLKGSKETFGHLPRPFLTNSASQDAFVFL